MAKIRHIAFLTEDPERLANFYVAVFGMTITQVMPYSPESGRAVFITDGYMDIALIAPADPTRAKGINHMGFTCDGDEMPGLIKRLAAHGIETKTPPADRPYVEQAIRDLDGNRLDLSTTGLRG